MAELLYQGHASFRIISSGNAVVYVDPFAGVGYDIPADIILITHQHGDHNQIDMVKKADDCSIITNADALKDKTYKGFRIKGVTIEAVEAYNSNHRVDECVGYKVSVDGKKMYFAGDTSQTEQMKTFAKEQFDYAFLPCDGVYNMSVEESSKCAELINAGKSVPIHMKPGALFDKETAERFTAPNRLIIEPGQVITL